jgi:hypoxanthine phosphoribosyltransferase
MDPDEQRIGVLEDFVMMENREMYADLKDELLLPREQIAARVKEMAAQITEDFKGKDLTVICILKGAVVFFVDLVREIDLPMSMDFMAISSYGSATKSSGVVRILKDLDKPINGKDVLIIEDIVDSGMTLSFLKENLLSRGAASLKIVTLLDKPERRRVPLHVDYFGFLIPDEFVVGYGLDYDEKYRNLPDIGVLRPEVYEK